MLIAGGVQIDEHLVAKLNADGLSQPQIARRLNVGLQHVRAVFAASSLVPTRTTPRQTRPAEHDLRDRHEQQRQSVAALSRHYGITRNLLYRALEEYGIPVRRTTSQRERAAGDRWCKHCQQLRPVGEFSTKGQNMQERCRRCRAQMATAQRQADPERAKAEGTAYRAANRRQRAMHTARWQAEHPEYQATWRAGHPDLVCKQSQRGHEARQQRLQQVESTLTPEQWHTILVVHAGRCAYCDSPTARLEIEHVVPVARLGAHAASNVVPACRSCNARKHDEALGEWRPSFAWDDNLLHRRAAAGVPLIWAP